MEVTATDIGLSSLRWFIGLLIGSSVGIIFGLISYSLKSTSKVVNILFNFFRSIPIIGLMPVIQMCLGVSEIGKIGLIAWGVMFPVWLSVQSAITKRLPELELVLKANNLSKRELLIIYIIPKVTGGIMLGIQVGIGIGWLCVVAAELIGTFSQGFWAGGLGYKLYIAHQSNNWYMVLTSLGLFGVMGTISSTLWKKSVSLFFSAKRGFNPLLWLERG